MVTTRTYRNDNLTTLIDVRDGSNAQLDSFAYTYDANQNKTAETRTGVMAPWGWSTGTSGYDAEDRLRAWNRTDGQLTQGWNLTLEGDWQQFTQNGTPQNRTHGLAHELTAVGGTGLTYDVKGNLAQAATGHRYTWDFDNQLQGVDTSGDQVADVTFGYDALGRRVKKTASGATKVYVSATQPIAYSPQAGQELVEYVSGAAPTSPTEKYVYGDYIDEPIWKTGTGGAVYYHANALYCVSALTNGSGAAVERYRYTPYGELTILAADGVTVRSASTYANPYTYTGRRWDSETGLYYYRARYYHPALGRFIGRDPIETTLDVAKATYVWNTPFMLTDPLGLYPFTPLSSARTVSTVSANWFAYIPAPPSPSEMTVTGFVFQWRVFFSDVTKGQTGYQTVSTQIEARDNQGKVLHSYTSGIVDISDLNIPPSQGGGFGFTDLQDATGVKPAVDQWVRGDPKVCEIAFKRKGDMRIVDERDIQIVRRNGTVEKYDPSIHGTGQLIYWYVISSAINGATYIHGDLSKSRVLGQAAYRIVWHDEVRSLVVQRSKPTYKIKGRLRWDTGIGGAGGAKGLPVFPDKPTIEPNLGYDMDIDFTKQWYPG